MSPRSRSRRGEVPLSGEHRDPTAEPGPGTTDEVLDAREQRQSRGRKRPGPGAKVGDTGGPGAGGRARASRRPAGAGAVDPVEPVDPNDDPAGPG
jgi:hypothetical protein